MSSKYSLLNSKNRQTDRNTYLSNNSKEIQNKS